MLIWGEPRHRTDIDDHAMDYNHQQRHIHSNGQQPLPPPQQPPLTPQQAPQIQQHQQQQHQQKQPLLAQPPPTETQSALTENPTQRRLHDIDNHTTGLSQEVASCNLQDRAPDHTQDTTTLDTHTSTRQPQTCAAPTPTPTHLNSQLQPQAEPPRLVPPPGLTQPPPQNNLPDPATLNIHYELQELLEQEISEFSEIIQARAATARHYSPPNLHQLSQSDDTSRAAELQAFLQSLGYEPSSDNPFSVMGFAELDGPELTTASLTRRLRFADNHIKHFTTPDAQHTCNELLRKIHVAHERCLTLLPEIRTKRKLLKGITKQTDHWRELHKEGISYLSGIIFKGTNGDAMLATQLSNVLRQDLSGIPCLASIEDTRTLFGKLNSPSTVIEGTLRSISIPITTWAPDGQSQVLKVAATYREMLAKGQGPQSLNLLFPIDHYPGCTEPAHITDIWGHPLLGGKYADIVLDVAFILPPMRMITSGQHAPIHTTKCMAMISLGRHNQNNPAQPRIIASQEYLFNLNLHCTIWIDVPYEHRWHIYGLIDSFALPGHGHTDSPRPSLGHRAQEPRSTIKVHFNHNIGSELMQTVVIRWLRRTLHVYQPIIGRQATIADPTAHILDITSPSGAFRFSNLYDDCILVSPRLAIVSTSASPGAWSQQMTHSWEQDPNKCALLLRHRGSNAIRDKRIAEVAATKEQISAARARKGHHEVTPSADKPLTLRATIELPVQVDAGCHTWLPHMMAHIAHLTGTTLHQHLGEAGLEMGTWKAVHNFEGHWTGRVLLQCRSANDLITFYKAIHNKGINIQGHMSAVSLHSDYIDLENHNAEDF